MQHVLITGANRGIGLAVVEHFLSTKDVVLYATARKPNNAIRLHELKADYPDRLHIIALEVREQSSIDDASQAISELTPSLDILVNNAGVDYGDQSFDAITPELMLDVYHINTIAPLMIARAFVSLLKNSSAPIIANISSEMASISDRRYGGEYAYCGSKAALNMTSRGMAIDLKKYNIITVALDPGWARTDMGGQSASLSPQQSAEGIVSVLTSLTSRDNGRFLTWAGGSHPW